MSWRKLAQLVRWLPKDAALYQSMRLARPEKKQPGVAAHGDRLVVTDPLEAMQHGYLEDLVLTVLNRVEAGQWVRADEKSRGSFRPTLPRGYGHPTAADGGGNDGADLAAYFAGMQPAPDDRPEV